MRAGVSFAEECSTSLWISCAMAGASVTRKEQAEISFLQCVFCSGELLSGPSHFWGIHFLCLGPLPSNICQRRSVVDGQISLQREQHWALIGWHVRWPEVHFCCCTCWPQIEFTYLFIYFKFLLRLSMLLSLCLLLPLAKFRAAAEDTSKNNHGGKPTHQRADLQTPMNVSF